jgi:hypothetical protein
VKQFWIFDFRFRIEKQPNKFMNVFSSKLSSDNRKSAIQNPKWAGIVAIDFTFALCGGVAQAQQPQKIRRIGYLSPQTPAREAARAETIRSALRELGYVEGQNILIEYRYANGHRDRQPELAAELVRLNVDVILVTGGEPYLRGL